MLRRFKEMPIDVLPELEGDYVLVCKREHWDAHNTVGNKYGYFDAIGYTAEGWNTHRNPLDPKEVSKKYAYTPEEMVSYFESWLMPVQGDGLTPYSYDQLLDEVAKRIANALDQNESDLTDRGFTKEQISEHTYYLTESLKYIKRMIGMLEGEIA